LRRVQRQQAAENMQKRPDRVPETGKSAQKQQEGRGSWLFWVETGTVFAAAHTDSCFTSLLERVASLPVQESQVLRSVSLCPCRIQEVRSGRTHPADLRSRVIAFVEGEYGHREAARHFRVSPRFVNDMVNLKRESGGLLPKAQGNHAKGKVALISGRVTGLGGAASTLFAAEGAAVAIVDRNLDQAQARVAEITAAGGPSPLPPMCRTQARSEPPCSRPQLDLARSPCPSTTRAPS
jgi:hypothetical protein